VIELPPNSSLTSPAWDPPSRRRLYGSAFIDGIAWIVIWLVVGSGLDWLVRSVLGMSYPGGPDARDDLSVFSMGLGALGANLYLAFASGAGKSIGKDIMGLRLVSLVRGIPARPGFAAGLVRSSVQALPCMGALSVLTGMHDAIAGTTIARIADATVWDRWWSGITPAENGDALDTSAPPARVGSWKIVVAILVHLAAVPCYAVLSAV
jgi:uncharacterized RDD family membrane protein YckC